MKTELEVIRLSDNDVIITSCKGSCLGMYGHNNSNDDKFVNVYKNGNLIYWLDHDDSGTTIGTVTSSFPNNFTLKHKGRYYYHSDETGHFIEWCPSAGEDHTNEDTAKAAHGVSED